MQYFTLNARGTIAGSGATAGNYPGTNIGAGNGPVVKTATTAAPVGGVVGLLTPGTWSGSGGTATSSTATYSEVGTLALILEDRSYADVDSADGQSGTADRYFSGIAPTVGRFTPDHFDTQVTQGCATGGFTYSGQPFTTKVTALNASGSPTLNYDSSLGGSKTVTLSDANLVPNITASANTISSFASGVGSGTPAFTFARATPDPAPDTIKLRATDTDGVSSASGTEGTAYIEIGRLSLANGFVTGGLSLQLPVRAHFWSGKSWIVNAADSCTVISNSRIALSGYLDSKGSATAAWTTTVANAVTLAGGQGSFTLTAPSPSGSTGSVSVAANLGTGTADTSCLPTHTAMVAPALDLSFLRGKNGNCAASNAYAADPSARATFGVFSAEAKKAVHTRELY
jgi:MSHA biogenesis protein MshQ